MDDRVAQAAARLDAVAAPVGLQRLESLGEYDSGAYNFYAVRLRRGTIFSDYDLALASALLAWPNAPRQVHEIGGGFGNLCFLLAMLGFDTVCVEGERRRFAAADEIGTAMSAHFPEVRDHYRLVQGQFPVRGRALAAAGKLALTTNLVCTTSKEDEALMLAGLGRYDFLIADVDRFLVRCTTPDQRQARISDFEAAGLQGEPFLDLGASASFYRFRKAPTLSRWARLGALLAHGGR